MIFAMVTMIYLILTMFAMVAMIYLFLFLQEPAETRPTHDTPASHVSLSTLIILIIEMRIILILMMVIILNSFVITLKKDSHPCLSNK